MIWRQCFVWGALMVGEEGINNQKVVVSSHPLSKSDVAHSVL